MAYLGGLFDTGVEFRHQLSIGTDDQPQEKVCYGGWLVTARHWTIKKKQKTSVYIPPQHRHKHQAECELTMQ